MAMFTTLLSRGGQDRGKRFLHIGRGTRELAVATRQSEDASVRIPILESPGVRPNDLQDIDFDSDFRLISQRH